MRLDPAGTKSSTVQDLRSPKATISVGVRCAGSKRGPAMARNSPPTSARTRPNGAISNMEKGLCPRFWETPSTSRFVDVPINEHVPPRITM